MKRKVFLASFLAAFFLAATVGFGLRSFENSLRLYPDWKSEKPDLGLGLMGAQSFLVAPNSLAGRELNLGAWHGHQVLKLLRRWETLPEVQFHARAEEPGYVALELSGGSDRLAIRLSNDAEKPSAFLRLDARGNFLGKEEINYLLPSEKLAHLTLAREGARLKVLEGPQEIARTRWPEGPVELSWRGSGSPFSVVDNISIALGAEKYSQSFSGSFPFVTFALVWMIGFLFLAWAHRFSGFVFHLGLPLFGLVLLGAYELKFAPLYPGHLSLSGLPNHILGPEAARREWQAFSPGQKPIVVWLGGSQAWGAGASGSKESTFGRLAARFPRYQWANGALSEFKVKDLREPLEVFAAKGPVAAVILVVGVNDAINPNFAADLTAFLERAREVSARVLLVVEPVAKASGEVEAAQGLVRGVSLPGVEIFDLQASFAKRGDAGFDWWDFVHLTDAGQAFAARELSAVLEKTLNRSGR